MLTLSDFDYLLPTDRIAQTPASPRDHSKLMVVDRETGGISHHHFYDLPTLLRPTDLVVMNNSKTMPMRTFGKKETGGKVEVMFIKKIAQGSENETWEVLTRPGIKKGQKISFDDTSMVLTCLEDTTYTRVVLLEQFEGSVVEVLHHIGRLPTPHYITTVLENENDYQTIYAKPEGSAATPTAGLHFTPSILKELNTKGIHTIEITLHVGLGTFLPVKTEDITHHEMHREWFTLSDAAAQTINAAIRDGRRIVAVGTTTTRVLESCAEWNEAEQKYLVKPQTGETQAFFYPPYTFKIVQALITNFHLPKSTLLMLLSAFCSNSQKTPFTTFQNSLAGKAYTQAIANEYRFFSFGDAMLVT